MQENSNENKSQHYLDSQNNEAQSQEEERIEDVGHNFDQMGAMNRYPENININDPESNQNPLSNLMFNKDQNVVEEKSNKFLSFLDKYKESFGKYFNVEVSDIKQKLKGSLIPFNKSFYESIEINADLYGPFWIFTTIIFLIALIGNFSSYVHAEDKTKFVYDYNHVPHAIFIIYGFGFGAPIVLWIIMKFIFRIDIDLFTNLCIYGYSYTILIPILLVCIIPFKLVATLALLYFLIHSCTFLFHNMYLVIQQRAQKSKYVVLGLLGGIQLLLFFFLKFYFFG
jgi:hypothetical protein